MLNWFKRGVGEMMIARPDDAKAFVVWKHPDPTIPMKSQLTVMEDEEALFLRDGKVVEILGPGRHTLDSSNLPFLSNLVDSFTGGDVFRAEVYFVSKREHPGIKFGGRVGHVEDPKSGVPCELMVHGEFSFRVQDARTLVLGLVGTGATETYQVRSWLKEQVLKVIRDDIAELLVKNKWPLLDVTSGAYTEEIEESVIVDLEDHVDDYGVHIVRLGNFVIAIDEEDSENLKRLYTDAAYLKTAGGVQGFQQFAAGKAMMGAGEGMAQGGGGAGGGGAEGLLGGAGLGVGLGMAQMLVQNAQGGADRLAPAVGGVVCGACGRSTAPGKFCGHCGESLQTAETPAAAPGGFCTNCGAAMGPEAKFCGQCGTGR